VLAERSGPSRQAPIAEIDRDDYERRLGRSLPRAAGAELAELGGEQPKRA
jgi:hypothetical protein